MASSSNEEAMEDRTVNSWWHKLIRLFQKTPDWNQTTQPTLKKAEENDKQGIKSERKTTTEDLIDVDITDDGQSEEHQSEIFEDANDEFSQPAKPEIQLDADEDVDVTPNVGHVQDEEIDLAFQVEYLQSAYADLIRENEKLSNENRNLKTISEVVQADNQVIQLTNSVPAKAFQRHILEHFEQTKQHQEENNVLRRIIHSLQQEKSKMNDQMEHFREENREKGKENEQLRLESTERSNESMQLRQDNCRLNAQIEKFRRETNRKNNENRQLREEIASKNNEIERYKQDKNAMSSEIEQLQHEKGAMRNELRTLQRERNNMRIEIQHLQEITKSSFITDSGTVIVSDVELGRGSYGAVYKGNFHGTEVAVKEIHDAIVSEHYMKMLEREINIAGQCRHPNLLQFLCATKNDRNHLLIVTELMDTTLRSLYQERAIKKSRLNDQEIKSISLDVARGLNYLHTKKPSPIMHRDISSANVLLSIEHGEVGRAKISDYGSVNFMKMCKTQFPGAAVYTAPEASGAQYSPKIDVFSYGILVYEISIGVMPDKGKLELGKIRKTGIKKLVRNCTTTEPEKRPTMREVIGALQTLK